jgi:hypothetical protein
MRLDPGYLDLAFCQGLVRGCEITQYPVGLVNITTGGLVACDPLVYAAEAAPFSLPLPAGSYPVTLTVATLQNGDQRVAFARLDLMAGVVAEWDLMTLDGQDQTGLGADEIFGYPVDAGTGCFGDREAIDQLSQLMDHDESYWQQIDAALEKSYTQTWSWVNRTLPDGLNLVAFSSGYGDGIYPTYVALNDHGDLLSVVTDFIVVPGQGAP